MSTTRHRAAHHHAGHEPTTTPNGPSSRLGEPAEAFITQGATAEMTMLPKEFIEIVNDVLPAHGPDATTRAVARAVRFGRFRAADVRSILAIGIATPEPAPAGERVVVDLPAVEVRSADAYRIENLA